MKFDSVHMPTIRGRAIFTIVVIALYQPLEGFHMETYLAVTVLTIAAIWTPRRLRTLPYYLSVGAGALTLGLWQWAVTFPHMIFMDLFIPAVILLAGAPERWMRLSVILTSFIVLLSLVSGHFPADLWVAVTQIGVYMGVRSIRSRKEMAAMRRHYVAQLETTLDELKAAQAKLEEDAAQSMHYAAQAERFRIARDIHDGLGHQLTSLIVQLQALSYMIPDTLPEVRDRVPRLLAVARSGLNEVRQAVRSWEQRDDSYGLTALSAVVEEIRSTSRCHVDFQVDVPQSHEWSTNTQIVLYRVLQETLTNTVRHSNATHIEVQLVEQPRQVAMVVSDDGTTLLQAPGGLEPGFGLRNMRARCEEIGGHCTWLVTQQGGVRVEVTLPTGEMTLGIS